MPRDRDLLERHRHRPGPAAARGRPFANVGALPTGASPAVARRRALGLGLRVATSSQVRVHLGRRPAQLGRAPGPAITQRLPPQLSEMTMKASYFEPVTIELIAFAPRLLVKLAALGALVGAASGCVSAKRYEDAESAARLHAEGRQAEYDRRRA